MEKRKLLVIGIDGATFKIISPMVEEGRLPNIGRIMREGVYSDLITTIPSVTCTAWPSMVTGKNPRKHGIIDWHSYRSNYTEHFHNNEDLKGRRFWDYLGARGIECGIVNVPITYPPYKIKGFMVSGFPSVGEQVQFTYPKELREELLEKNYMIDSVDRSTLSDKSFFEKVESLMEIRKKVCLHLMKKKEWDMFFVVFRPEPIQARFWKEKSMDVVEKTYEIIDKHVGDLIKSQKEKMDVILVSDHGFGRTPEYNFYLNAWLSQNNYLKLHEKKKGKLPIDKIYRTLSGLGLGWTKYLVSKKLKKKRFIDYQNDVDWENSVCFGRFSEATGFIYLNRAERFDKGIIEKGDIERVREEIRNKLSELEYNGEKVAKRIWNKEELYGELDIAPDIIFEINDKFRGLEVSESISFAGIPKKDRKAWHELEGIFIAAGPNIKNLGKMEQKKIIDVAPTILDFYRIRKPFDMDGKTIKIFK